MRVFIFLLMMFFNFSVLAGPLPAKLDLFLKSTQNISFEFLQTKTITEAGISLKSSGYGKFEKNNGFLWKTLQPKSSVFIATTSNYCLNDEKKAVSELPYYEQIRQIVDNFFSSDMDALEEYFEIQIISSNDWMMALFPLVNKLN